MQSFKNINRTIEKIKGNRFLELIRQDVSLKRKSTATEEYSGPCPLCGGTDRFVVWPAEGRFLCRQCGFKGDAYQYLITTRNVPFQDAYKELNPTTPSGNGNKPPPHAEYNYLDKNSSPPTQPKVSKNQDKGTFEKSYFYNNATDNPYWREDVYRRKDGTKYCPISHWDEASGIWVSGKGGKQPILYSLSTLQQAQTIHIAEGPKCCDALVRLGFVATTNPCGAEKWKLVCRNGIPPEELHGKDIIIHEDNDNPGYRHTQGAVSSVYPHAKSVKIISYRNQREKYDVADLIEDLGPEEARVAIEALIAEASVFVPETPVKSTAPRKTFSTITAHALMQKTITPLLWIILKLLPGGLTLLAGKPKSAKSWLALEIAIAVATAQQALGYFQTIQSKVLGLFLEDSEESLRERLDLLVDDALELLKNLDLAFDCSPFAGGGVDQLISYIEANPETKLIIVDTWARFRPSRKQSGDIYAEDYSDLAILHSVAKQYGIAILLVHHAKKGTSEDPYDSVLGSTALSGATDTTLLLQRQPGNDSGVLLCRGRRLPDQAFNMTFQDCVWTCDGPRDEVAVSEASQQVREFLQSADGPKTMTDISKGTAKSYASIKKLIPRMLKRGEVEKSVIRGKYLLPNEDALYGDAQEGETHA